MQANTDVSSPSEEKPNDIKGGRNLLILGVVSVGIAIITTVISLVVYHKSGDIYLDRSRPGFLPDEEEVLKKPETTYSFPSSGVLTAGDIDDYILHFEEAVEVIDDLPSPFAATPLSDESLGIPAAPAEENVEF